MMPCCLRTNCYGWELHVQPVPQTKAKYVSILAIDQNCTIVSVISDASDLNALRVELCSSGDRAMNS